MERPDILFIIDSDPRISHKPAEAIRIVVGLAALKKLNISICLCEAAVVLLKKPTDDLKDGDQLERWLMNLKDHQVTVYIESGDPFVDALDDSPVAFQRISVTELAALVDASRHLIRF